MFKVYAPLFIMLLALSADAQTPQPPHDQPYGKVDLADLQLTGCDFEKTATAEVLFNKAVVTPQGGLKITRHRRIKIYSDFGKSFANIRITYFNDGFGNPISNLEAETINLENGKIQITPIDKKSIYTQKIDKRLSVMIFAFPNVKPGSIVEYQYQSTQVPQTWDFQTNIPTRYSELETDYIGRNGVRTVDHVKQPYLINIGKTADEKQVKVLANVPSLPKEPYMTSELDNWQRVEFYNTNMLNHTWDAMGNALLQFPNFGTEFNQSISGAGDIAKNAKSLNSTDEKIAFIFNTVKNTMQWDKNTSFYTSNSLQEAWSKKTGNTAEINLILYNLLRRADINAFPMLISTREHGKLNPANANPYAFNNTVVYIPVDSTRIYVLDATNKYNLFNVLPYDELNTFGLSINPRNGKISLIQIEDDSPVVQSVFLNAEIKPEGKITGTVEITSDAYNKIDAIQYYKTMDQEKHIGLLSQNDNSIKVSSFKMENMDVDSLPLTQKFDFERPLSGADENYIYFSTNVFSPVEDNPFKNETRFSDIDFGYRHNFSMSGVYKLPTGYKIDALPKSVTIVMPDQSILFKRIIAEDNGTILVRYMLDQRKTVFFSEAYQDIRGFYKKMYELLNEQIVLKKI